MDKENILKRIPKIIQIQRKNMNNLDKVPCYEATIKYKDKDGELKISFEGTLIDKKDAEERIKHIEETHKQELQKANNEIEDLKKKIEETQASLQEAQEALAQTKSEYESQKEEYEMKKKKLEKEYKDLENKYKALKEKNKDLEREFEQEKEAHNETQQKAINKITTLQEELEGLQRDVKQDLYTLYKQICPEGDNYGIEGKNLYTFLITSGQVETLEYLAESAKDTAINKPELFSKEKELFNQLFDSMQGYYKLKRIVPKVGDEYNENYYKVEGDSTGKITEVILDGFTKNDKLRQKPLVKVKR